MPSADQIVFLLDVDNTLLDNDRAQDEYLRYILIDDKIRILAAVKQQWAERVTTVFVRQGHYALDEKTLALYPPADVSIELIGDLQAYTLADLLANSTTEIKR